MTSIILDQEVYQTNDFSPFALTDILTEYAKKINKLFYIFGNMNRRSSSV